MKRFLATLGGLAVGLIVTWLCLFLLSRTNLPHWGSGDGCNDVEHCGASWLVGLMLLVFLAPSVIFAVAGYLSVARSWSAARAVKVFCSIAAGTALAALALYTR